MTDFIQGLNRNLFGGSEQSSEQRDLTPEAFKQLRAPISDIFKGLFQGGAPSPLSGIPSFPGPLAAPIAPGEQAQLDRLGSLTTAGVAGGEFNPFIQDAINSAVAPFQRAQDEFLTRQLPSVFTQAGQKLGPGGSSAAARFGAEGSADIAGRAAEAAGGVALEGLQLGQTEINAVVQNLQAQALPRLISELGIERGLAEFQARVQALIQALSVAQGVAAPTLGTFSSGTSQSGIFEKVNPQAGGSAAGLFG